MESRKSSAEASGTEIFSARFSAIIVNVAYPAPAKPTRSMYEGLRRNEPR